MSVLVFTADCGPTDGPQNSAAAVAQSDRAADDAAIRAWMARVEAATNARDFAALAAESTADGDVIALSGARVSGRAEMQARIDAVWAAAPADRSISLVLGRIRYIGADTAIVDNLASFSAGEPRQNRGTMVLVRQDGTWRAVAVRIYPAEAR
jgi:uncharacterized protein (TIGR02246 family)